MGKSLRVLIVEDLEDDALLVIRELERGGYDIAFERVETAEVMTAALEKQAWDIIIADYHLPHFSAPEALTLLQQSNLDLPFIVVSGTIGEETAVATMRDGAHDYLMKGNLKRLVPAIERELHEAEVRRKRQRAEEALRESEKKYRELTDFLPQIVLETDERGNLKFLNYQAFQSTGYTPDDFNKGLSAMQLVIPEDRGKVKKNIQLVLSGKKRGGVEYTALRKDGSTFPIIVYTTPITHEGKAVGLRGIIVDITARKQAEEALKSSEERLRILFENAPDGIYLTDLKGTFVDGNRVAEVLVGYKKSELIGKSFFKLNLLPTGQIPKAAANLAQSALGQPTGPDEFILRRRDGSQISVEISTFPLKIKDKTLVLGIARDITERKRAEEKIKLAAEEWRTTFDSITDLVSIHDKDFRLVRVNKAFAETIKMEPKELIGKTCYEVVHGTNEPASNCPHTRTLEDGKPHAMELFEPHLGVYLEMSVSPIFNEEGEVVGTVHITKDITERKKMEEQLIVTDRLASIGELSSGIAHELNNPLTGIIGFSDLLLDRDVPDDVKEDLKIINREAKRTAGVVRNLLTFARKHAPAKELVDIHSIIQTVMELRAYEQKIENIQVVTQFATDLPEVKADGFQLQQVFLNIIINAEYFMTEAHGRGSFTITTERIGDIIRVSFADDGPGIAEENLLHLYDPFFTTKEVGKGTGLGLSISYGIITEHAGRIYAQSKLGKGATFVVELPIAR